MAAPVLKFHGFRWSAAGLMFHGFGGAAAGREFTMQKHLMLRSGIGYTRCSATTRSVP